MAGPTYTGALPLPPLRMREKNLLYEAIGTKDGRGAPMQADIAQHLYMGKYTVTVERAFGPIRPWNTDHINIAANGPMGPSSPLPIGEVDKLSRRVILAMQGAKYGWDEWAQESELLDPYQGGVPALVVWYHNREIVVDRPSPWTMEVPGGLMSKLPLQVSYPMMPTIPRLPLLDDIEAHISSTCVEDTTGYTTVHSVPIVVIPLDVMLNYCPDLPEVTQKDGLEHCWLYPLQHTALQDPLILRPLLDYCSWMLQAIPFTSGFHRWNRPMRLCEAVAIKLFLQERCHSLLPYMEAIRNQRIDDDLCAALRNYETMSNIRHLFFFLDCIPNNPGGCVYTPRKSLADVCCLSILNADAYLPSIGSGKGVEPFVLRRLIDWWTENFEPVQSSHRQHIARFIQRLAEGGHSEYISILHSQLSPKVHALAPVLRVAYAASKSNFAQAVGILPRCGNPRYWREWLLSFPGYASKPVGTII